MKVKRILSILLACSLVISLSACGNKAKTTTNASVKDSVTVACAFEPKTFFPYHTKSNTNMDDVPILHNVYETLVKLGSNSEHLPLLAEKWEVSNDGKDYTFHLRKGVTFQDGNKMTAEDVAFSLNLSGKSIAGSSMLANYDNAKVIDDSTVVVHLTDPYAPFLNALSARYGLIIEKALFEKEGQDAYNKAPIGTGPYKFVQQASGDNVTLKANENYWGGVPAIKNVTFKVISDTNTQMVSLQNGDIDALIRANVSPLLKLKTDKIKYSIVPASSISNMSFNCAKGPAADINFRKAVQAGVNKQEVNNGAFEGKATIGDIYIPASFSGRPDDGTFKVVKYDQNKAKEYLAASKYNGEEFKILTVSGTKDETAAQIVQGQLIALGIKATVNALDSSSFMAARNAGDYGVYIRAGGVSVMDADGLYGWHSTQLLKPGYFDTKVASPEMDKLLTAGRTETDPNKRKEIYRQVVDMITDNVYNVTLYYEANACAYKTNLKGVEPGPLTGLYFFNNWSW